MAQLPLPKVSDAGLSTIMTRWKSILDPMLASSGYVGEIRMAALTEKQFQAQAGSGWVLADGRNVSGSQYESLSQSKSIPDLRGTVPRMKDNGKGLNPAGDLALGSYQADAFQGHFHAKSDPGHSHTQRGQVSTTSLPGGTAGTASSNGDAVSASSTQPATTGISITGASSDGTNGTPRTGKETCAKSTTLNFFIRIN